MKPKKTVTPVTPVKTAYRADYVCRRRDHEGLIVAIADTVAQCLVCNTTGHIPGRDILPLKTDTAEASPVKEVPPVEYPVPLPEADWFRRNGSWVTGGGTSPLYNETRVRYVAPGLDISEDNPTSTAPF